MLRVGRSGRPEEGEMKEESSEDGKGKKSVLELEDRRSETEVLQPTSTEESSVKRALHQLQWQSSSPATRGSRLSSRSHRARAGPGEPEQGSETEQHSIRLSLSHFIQISHRVAAGRLLKVKCTQILF